MASTASSAKGAVGLAPGLVVALVTAEWAGVALDGAAANLAAVAAIIAFGVPHGALDIERVRRANGLPVGNVARLGLLADYVAVAALMTLLWLVAAPIALALFLVIAAFHFGEDWTDVVSCIEAFGLGAVMLAFPALFHTGAVIDIFSALTNPAAGSALGEAVAFTAWPAAILAAFALVRIWRGGHRYRVRDTVAAICAAVLLPPLIAFAIYFCVIHSPRHLHEALAELPASSQRRAGFVITAVTALALAIGVALFAIFATQQSLDVRLVSTAFILLSVLTAPHLLLHDRKL